MKPVICSPNLAILIAYAKHGNILHARGCTICSANVTDNSGTKACGIFVRAGKIHHAGCEVVKQPNLPKLLPISAVTPG